MTAPVVLAWSGGRAATRALAHLRASPATSVVAVAFGFRADDPLEAWAAQARAAGAHQCHLVDLSDDYARDVAWSLAVQGLDPWPVPIAHAARLMAGGLVRVARLGHATVVAHGARGAAGRALEAAIHALDPSLRVLGLPPMPLPAEACDVRLTLEHGAPTHLNGVSLSVRELFETLEVLVGADQVVPVLSAAWRQLGAADATGQPTGTASLRPGGTQSFGGSRPASA